MQYCSLNSFLSLRGSVEWLPIPVLFSSFFLSSTLFPGSLSGKKGKSLGTCWRDHRTQCNDSVFVTYLSLFSVALFTGETVRGDSAPDIANKTVSLHRILPYRLQNFEVVLICCRNVSWFIGGFSLRLKLFVFKKI